MRSFRRVPGTRLPSIRLVGLALVVCFAALPGGVAQAHAERTESRPGEGSRLDRPPKRLTIHFTEPPTGDAVVDVADGCGNPVVSGVTVQNQDVMARLSKGQPGKWSVGTTVVSGLDGHQTKDSWSFRVTGRSDCSRTAAAPTPRGTEERSGDGFPIIPALGIAFGALFAALLLRALTGRSGD